MVSLAKWLSVRLQTKWLWVRIPLQSLNYICWKYKFGRIDTLTNILAHNGKNTIFKKKLVEKMLWNMSVTEIY